MHALRNVMVGSLLLAAATAVATAGEAPIETIVVTAKWLARPESSPTVEKVLPVSAVEIAVPMPTDMPEAEIDYHMLRISLSPESSAAERAKL